MTEAIILAGGMGTRLQGVTDNLAKSMALIAGKPFLEYQLSYLKSQGLVNVIFSVGYYNEQIISYFGNNWNGLHIRYSIENEPLGTGGALKKALSRATSEHVVVMNGDTLFTIDLNALIQHHLLCNADTTIALRNVPDAGRFGSVVTDPSGRIIEFKEKKAVESEGLINGGIYVIRKATIEGSDLPEKFSLEKYFFAIYCKTANFQGIAFVNYFLDIGIPEDFRRSQVEFPKLNLDATTR